MSVFSLNEVRVEQVKNVAYEDRKFPYWREENIFGYYGGGQTSPGANISVIDRLDFSTETRVTPPSVLSTTKSALVSVSSGIYGYFAGGFIPTPAVVSTIERLQFSTETRSTLSATLTVAKAHLQGAYSSSSYGYFHGGLNSLVGSDPAWFKDVDRLDFSSDTRTSMNLNYFDLTRRNRGASISTPYYGYMTGGLSGLTSAVPPIVFNITRSSIGYRFDFFNETLNTNSLIIIARDSLGAISSSGFGYFIGGVNDTPANDSSVSRFDFATESRSLANPFPTVRAYFNTTSNSTFGYTAGGANDVSGYISTINRYDLSTETVINSPALLSQSHIYQSAFSGGQSLGN